MTPFWGDLVTRARGLSARWLLGERLGAVERASDLGEIRRRLEALGYPIADPGDAAAIERATQEVAARWWAILGRWAGERRRQALAFLFEEEEARAVERLARLAIQGVRAREGPGGVIPTPGLDPGALRRLAETGSIGEMARELARRDRPWADVLEKHAGSVRVDLWSLELSLETRFLARARRSAARADRAARDHVERSIDHRNLWTALLVARNGRGTRVTDVDLYVEGGRRLGREEFDTAIGVSSDARPERLSSCFAEGALRDALAGGRDLATLESAAREDRLAAQLSWFRRAPLSSAGVTAAVLALSIEQRRIRSAAWRLEMAGTRAA